MSNWNVNVGCIVNFDYNDIKAETREEAEEIAIARAKQDLAFNSCDCSEPEAYWSREYDTEVEDIE